MSILDRIRGRRPVVDHDGRSGATLERGILDDGTPVYVKTAVVADDIGLLLTGDARRELHLWENDIFENMPPQVGSALLAVEDHGDRLITVTRDLGASMLSWDRTLAKEDVGRIFEAIGGMHRRFQGRAPLGRVPLATRIALFAPSNLDTIAVANADLAAAIRRGHEAFADLVPGDVASAVHRCYADPEPLARAMAANGTTLLHGDFFLVNIALEPEQITLLDWGFATVGPAAIDLITFCLSAMSNVEHDRGELVDAARASCVDVVDDDTWNRSAFWALMEAGWNKALDALHHPFAAKRAVERSDLEFWIRRAQVALDAGVVPTCRRERSGTAR